MDTSSYTIGYIGQEFISIVLTNGANFSTVKVCVQPIILVDLRFVVLTLYENYWTEGKSPKSVSQIWYALFKCRVWL